MIARRLAIYEKTVVQHTSLVDDRLGLADDVSGRCGRYAVIPLA